LHRGGQENCSAKPGERIILEFAPDEVVASASSTNERIVPVRAIGIPTASGAADVSTSPNEVEVRPLFAVPSVQVLVTLRSGCSYVFDVNIELERKFL
jgi:hypothetical protein